MTTIPENCTACFGTGWVHAGKDKPERCRLHPPVTPGLPPAASLGKRVRVTLGENLVIEGKLLAFSDDGTAVVGLDEGVIYHAWPMLAIEEIPDVQ